MAKEKKGTKIEQNMYDQCYMESNEEDKNPRKH